MFSLKTSICMLKKSSSNSVFYKMISVNVYSKLKIWPILFDLVPLGAYLLPYLILLLVIGIPLFFLELSVGQRIRRGSIGVWNYISPKLGGIGFASCVVSFFLWHLLLPGLVWIDEIFISVNSRSLSVQSYFRSYWDMEHLLNKTMTLNNTWIS